MLEKVHEYGSKIRHTAFLQNQSWLWQRLEPAWQQVFRQFSGKRGFATHINNDTFRLSYEWGSRYDRPDQRVYEPVFYSAFVEAISEGMTVLEIGSHIGILALGAGKRVGKNGRVYAFEPNPVSAEILEHHIELNDFQNHVHVIRSVVSDFDGTIEFFLNGTSMAASLSKENVEVLSPDRPKNGAESLKAPSVTLDSFCGSRQIKPDVLKIDVEGAELRVLRGASGLLRSRNLRLFCEIHPQQMQNCGSSLEEMLRFLADCGYTLKTLDAPNSIGIFHARIEPQGQ